ncbi:serine acetyltransferase [Dysgonomonas sp. HDW5B]|uniref:serine O-acetyltransferase n=1 Tax=Dysgonomonas sp. HDW5B TaxID=2714927 RepID=UPI00140E3B35|nr:serine acetyltransferase [Dysgonomonas sp. HDW5B]QIK52864.1 serine acetyltransferase [Dysgonomonas sp. HDW5B]
MDTIKRIANIKLWEGAKVKNIYFAFQRYIHIPKELYYSFKYYLSFKPVRSCDITRGMRYLGKKRTVLPHPVGIVIGEGVSLGDDCRIFQNVTIGVKSTKENIYPTIGDNVIISANAVIIGNIHIGNNVTIGAGSIVLSDVPNNAVVAGNPARIISYKK